MDSSNPAIKPSPCVTARAHVRVSVCVCGRLSVKTTLDSSQWYIRHTPISISKLWLTHSGGLKLHLCFWGIARATGSLRLRLVRDRRSEGCAVRQRCFDDLLKNIVGIPAGLSLQGMFCLYVCVFACIRVYVFACVSVHVRVRVHVCV